MLGHHSAWHSRTSWLIISSAPATLQGHHMHNVPQEPTACTHPGYSHRAKAPPTWSVLGPPPSDTLPLFQKPHQDATVHRCLTTTNSCPPQLQPHHSDAPYAKHTGTPWRAHTSASALRPGHRLYTLLHLWCPSQRPLQLCHPTKAASAQSAPESLAHARQSHSQPKCH